MVIRAIVALVEPGHRIGYQNGLAYTCPEDRERFARLTTGGVLVMGRKTFESLPADLAPRGREALVLSTGKVNPQCRLEYKVFQDFPALRDHVIKLEREVWICGGPLVYRAFVNSGVVETIFLTKWYLHVKVPADTFYKPSLAHYWEVESEEVEIRDGLMVVSTWKKGNPEELAYYRLLDEVLRHPLTKGRNGPVHSLFGRGQLQFNLDPHFPLLTGRRIWFKGVVGELLFFLSGQTDTKILERDKINIWKGNTSREFLNKKGLPYKEGDMGPGYGFQWRHWGAGYRGCKADYKSDGGVDQIKKLLQDLREQPFSRRHILSAWNVGDLDKMALEPCHLLAQFNVREVGEDRTLDTHVYMRSCDMFHGLPFNIASYALLNRIFCQELAYRPGILTFSFGNLHIYQEHEKAVRQLFKQIPGPFPTLSLAKKPWSELTPSDFTLHDYKPGPDIKVPMVV